MTDQAFFVRNFRNESERNKEVKFLSLFAFVKL